MNKPLWLLNLIKEMKRAGVIKEDQTGKILLEINLTQGGTQSCNIMVGETYR